MKRIVISVAPIKSDTEIDNNELAKDIKLCIEKGASICHLHSRDMKGALTKDFSYMKESFESILQEKEIIVQASTGGVSSMNMLERCSPLSFDKVQMASLNGGTTNLGESVYVNSLDDIRFTANEVYKRRIIPEIEVFDIGMIHNIERLKETQPFNYPIIYNLVFGHIGGMEASIDDLIAFRSRVPESAIWGVTHYGRENWNFIGAAVAMGASLVRIGFEDSSYLTKNIHANKNYLLVERLAAIIRALGFEVAQVEEAKKILGILK